MEMNYRACLRLQAGVQVHNREHNTVVPLGQDRTVWCYRFEGREVDRVAIFKFDPFDQEEYDVRMYDPLVEEIGSSFSDSDGNGNAWDLLSIVAQDSARMHRPIGPRASVLSHDAMSVWKYEVSGGRNSADNDRFQLVLRSQRNRIIKVELDRRDWFMVFGLLASEMKRKDQITAGNPRLRHPTLEGLEIGDNGIIRSPGKFEGEMLYVPYYWDAYLNGLADQDSGGVIGFDVSAEDRKLFPELGRKRTVRLHERDDGFVEEL
jgi:hypothetical protein